MLRVHERLAGFATMRHATNLVKPFMTLEPVPNLIFYPEYHKYQLNKKWLARSTTEVINFDMPEEKKYYITKSKDGPNGWKRRGDAVHDFLENFLRKQSFTVDDHWREWTEAIADNELLKTSSLIAAEYRLCDKQKSMGGSFDFLLKKPDGTLVLGDLKSVSKCSYVNSRESATAQLGSYAQMLNKIHPNLYIHQCATIVAGPGKTRTIYDDVDICVSNWEEKWDTYHLTRRRW